MPTLLTWFGVEIRRGRTALHGLVIAHDRAIDRPYDLEGLDGGARGLVMCTVEVRIARVCSENGRRAWTTMHRSDPFEEKTL